MAGDPGELGGLAVGEVAGSSRGAVSASRPIRFPGPPSEPTCDFHRIRLSTRPVRTVLERPVAQYPRRAGAHVGSAVFTVDFCRAGPLLLPGCPPSPCGRLSRPRTTTGTPPRHGVISRRRACPRPEGGEGDTMTLPTFTITRLTRSVPSCAPTASPRVRRRPSSWPPPRPRNTEYGVATRRRRALQTGPSRRCQGCSHPSRASPRSGCPQLRRPAATGRRWSPFIPAR